MHKFTSFYNNDCKYVEDYKGIKELNYGNDFNKNKKYLIFLPSYYPIQLEEMLKIRINSNDMKDSISSW